MSDNPETEAEIDSIEEERRLAHRRGKERRSLPTKNFNEGHYIFREFETGQEAFILKSGRVEIVRSGADGENATEDSLAILTEGAMFGEMALIDNEPRMASARAFGGPVTVIVVTQQQFDAMLEPINPFVKKLLKILSDHARASGQRPGEGEEPDADEAPAAEPEPNPEPQPESQPESEADQIGEEEAKE